MMNNVENLSCSKPGYVETTLSKDKRQECRDIVKTIKEFGITQRQTLFLVYLLSLELEAREAMITLIQACAEAQQLVDPTAHQSQTLIR